MNAQYANVIGNQYAVPNWLPQQAPAQPPPTPQETQAADARAAERQNASQRARTLLLCLLDDRQQNEFERDRAFTIRAESGQRYRLRWGHTANIEVLHRNRVTRRLCAHPHNVHELPIEDTLAAQLLHLRHNEQEFLRGANVHP